MSQIQVSGPYDRLYEARSGPLWSGVGRLVRRIDTWLAPGARIFDAGCGDGKNALHLIQQRYAVEGCDLSSIAIDRLQTRLRAAGHDANGFLVAAVEDLDVSSMAVDGLVSYGLFHCLNKRSRVDEHRRLQTAVRPGGVVIFSGLLDSRPLPPGHGTPGVELAAASEVADLFAGWDLLDREVGSFAEHHEPVVGRHWHDGCWIVARRPW